MKAAINHRLSTNKCSVIIQNAVPDTGCYIPPIAFSPYDFYCFYNIIIIIMLHLKSPLSLTIFVIFEVLLLNLLVHFASTFHLTTFNTSETGYYYNYYSKSFFLLCLMTPHTYHTHTYRNHFRCSIIVGLYFKLSFYFTTIF